MTHKHHYRAASCNFGLRVPTSAPKLVFLLINAVILQGCLSRFPFYAESEPAESIMSKFAMCIMGQGTVPEFRDHCSDPCRSLACHHSFITPIHWPGLLGFFLEPPDQPAHEDWLGLAPCLVSHTTSRWSCIWPSPVISEDEYPLGLQTGMF